MAARTSKILGCSPIANSTTYSSVWNGHYACTCYHPLFVFNQFGDLERCALRPGTVHSADGATSQGLTHLFAGRRGLRSRLCVQLKLRQIKVVPTARASIGHGARLAFGRKN